MFKKLLHELYTILVYINYYLSKKKFHKFLFIPQLSIIDIIGVPLYLLIIF